MKTKEQKRTEAQARQQAHESLSPIQKLTKLNSRPGESKRERERVQREAIE